MTSEPGFRSLNKHNSAPKQYSLPQHQLRHDGTVVTSVEQYGVERAGNTSQINMSSSHDSGGTISLVRPVQGGPEGREESGLNARLFVKVPLR